MTKPLSLALPPIDLHWAIEPVWATQMLRVLENTDWAQHAREYQEQQVEIEARRGDSDPADKPYQMQGGVAVLSMTGPITKRPQSFGNGASTVQMRRLVRSAANDPDVESIALIIDSPGGQVSGIYDLAEDLARAREKKRVVAYIEDLGASAAYALAAQADAIFANANAMVGSIGTFMVVQDLSRLAENAGVKVHVIRAGAFKGAGTPGTPVTDKHLSEFQRMVDAHNEMMLAGIAQGRGLPLAKISALADGRIHIAAEAERLGLIDGVSSWDATLSDMQAGRIGARPQTAALGGTEDERAMNRLNSFLAWLNGGEGDGPEAAAAPSTAPAQNADVTRIQQELEQERTERQKLQSQMAADRDQRIQADAEAFAAGCITDRRALPTEKASLSALYVQAAQDDAASPLQADAEGKPQSRVGRLKAAVSARPQHQLTQELVAAGAFVLPSSEGMAAKVDEWTAQARKDAETMNGTAGKGR